MRTIEPLPDDAVGIGAAFELAVRVKDEGHAAGHPGTEIAPRFAQDNRDATGHIFAAIGAAALDNDLCARIAHGEPLPRLSGR